MSSDPLIYHPITIEDVTKEYPPQELLNPHPPVSDGSVLAIGRAVYESMPAESVDSWTKFMWSTARDWPAGNLWLMPTYPRMTYPQAVYWPIACAFRAEREYKRRFDWFLWLDDDVLFDKSDLDVLFRAANAHDLKFIAACPYDRMPPNSPSVVEKVDGKTLKWVKAPDSGSYPVAMVGFNMCLFRRDVFEVVPEPWFSICGPSEGFSGIMPDWWWCIQMEKAGLQPWVCCDTNVRHLMCRGVAGKEMSVAHFAEHGTSSSSAIGDKTVIESPNTGALGTVPPTFRDGRTEYRAEIGQ